jgi:hypothetical protein
VLFDVLSDRAAAETKLKGTDWPTRQSFYSKKILTFIKTRVCSVVYSFAVCLRSELPLSRRITGGKGRIVRLLAYVPHVQEGGVAGGGNVTSSFPSCTIQRGTNFFF